MQSLKILVIVMGIAILVILAIVVFMIAGRVSGVSGGGGPSGFGEIELQVPLGCSIASAEGKDNTLIVRLDGLAERGCQQVLVVDLESGRVLGRVKAVPSP